MKSLLSFLLLIVTINDVNTAKEKNSNDLKMSIFVFIDLSISKRLISMIIFNELEDYWQQGFFMYLRQLYPKKLHLCWSWTNMFILFRLIMYVQIIMTYAKINWVLLNINYDVCICHTKCSLFLVVYKRLLWSFRDGRLNKFNKSFVSL